MSLGVCAACQKKWNEGSRHRADYHSACFNWLIAVPPDLQKRVDALHAKAPRIFESGASRDTNADKLNYEAYISPLVLLRYAVYMKKHERLPNGTTRPGDNWQRGIPKDAYMESLVRHIMTLWLHHDGYGYLSKESYQDTLCAVIFNASGLLFEDCKADGFDADTMDRLAK